MKGRTFLGAEGGGEGFEGLSDVGPEGALLVRDGLRHAGGNGGSIGGGGDGGGAGESGARRRGRGGECGDEVGHLH